MPLITGRFDKFSRELAANVMMIRAANETTLVSLSHYTGKKAKRVEFLAPRHTLFKKQLKHTVLSVSNHL